MRFIGEKSSHPLDLRMEFYGADMVHGWDMDAPEWVPAGGAWVFDPVDDEPLDRFGAHVPRWRPWGYGWVPPSTRYSLRMKTDDTKPEPAKHGGKRPGSGRKALDADGTVVMTARLTGKQKATFDMLGGVKWLREQLDLFGQDL